MNALDDMLERVDCNIGSLRASAADAERSKVKSSHGLLINALDTMIEQADNNIESLRAGAAGA